MVKAMPFSLYLPERGPVPIVQEGKWTPGPAWTSAENRPPPPPPGIRSRHLPARSVPFQNSVRCLGK